MRFLLIFLYFLFLYSNNSQAQDCDYLKMLVDTLASEEMHGRGYVNDGHNKAARLIATEYSHLNLDKFGGNYFQKFNISVNIFPDELRFRINDKVLSPGFDYIVDPKSSSSNNYYYNFKNVTPKNYGKVMEKSGKILLIIDKSDFKKEKDIQILKSIQKEGMNSNALLFLEKTKLTFSYSRTQVDYPVLHLLRSSFPDKRVKEAYYKIDATLLPEQETQNIIGYIKGTQYPDSFFVFSAHYDHLGRMGQKTYYPGANDNASGTAMILNLAKYFQENPPKYSIAFMAFGAEEAGILGSKHYVQDPLFPLNQIKFLINLDIFGTGNEGVKIVNSTIFSSEYERLSIINDSNHYLPKLAKRGKAANSDHHPFTEKGVRSFFIYTLGGVSFYHDIFDRPETLPLSKCQELSELLIKFIESY